MRWINLGMFVFGNYKNHYNIWCRISDFQHWDGLIWECSFSGLTKITAPRLLHHALPPFYKCWKLKLKRRERMKRLKTLEVKKLVALIKGEVLWLFQGAMQHHYVTLQHRTCSTLSFERMNIGQRSSSNKQQVTRTP